MIVFEDAYLTESQRLANADFLEFDATLAKYDTLYEAVDGEFRANLSLAEAKVFRECGTEDDLVALYEAADADANKKKGNILARAFRAIAEFLRKTVEKVKNAFSKNKEEEITVPKRIAEAIKYIVGEGKANINALINALNNLNGWVKIGAAVVPALAIADFINKHNDDDPGTQLVKAKEGEEAASLIGKLVSAISKAADKLPTIFYNKNDDESGDGEKKAINLKDLVHKISAFFAKILEKINNALNKGNNDNSNNNTDDQGNVEENPDGQDNGTEEPGNNQGNQGKAKEENSDAQGNSGTTGESVYDYIFDDSYYTVESQDDYSACMNYLDSLIADL
jgi:Skp family chaperone for outer membrane proteins